MLKHKPFLNGIIGYMNDEPNTPHPKLKLMLHARLTAIGILVLAVAIALFVNQMMTPKRSVAEYCKVYKVEKARLARLPGDTYPSLLFDHPLSDVGEFVSSLGKLERSAPNDIRPSVNTLQSLYQKLDSDPSQLTAVSFAAEPVDNNLSKWTASHCSE